MSLTIVRLTRFEVERLQCIGSRGRATPYRITTFHGVEIGSFGDVMIAAVPAGNAAAFEKKTGFLGLKRLLTTFSY